MVPLTPGISTCLTSRISKVKSFEQNIFGIDNKKNKKFLKSDVKICNNKNKPKLFLIVTFYACRW